MSPVHTNFTDEQCSSNDQKLIIGFIVNHPTELVIKALRRHGQTVAANSTKHDIRTKLEQWLEFNELDINELNDIQTELEGWGNQQIYLFKCLTSKRILKSSWYLRAWVEKHLQDVDPALVLDKRNPLALPESAQLIAVYYSVNCDGPRIRFVWAQKQIRTQRDPSLDSESDTFAFNEVNILERVIMQGYRETVNRGIISFDWDIVSGKAMLLIDKRSEREYRPLRKKIMTDLNDFFENVDFEYLEIRPAIVNRNELANFDNDIEVIMPRHDVSTTDGNRIALFNEHQKNVSEDSEVAEVQQRQQSVSNDYKLDIRWIPKGRKEFRVELSARVDDDQRIGIRAQRTEKEIRDVVRGIRCCL